MSERKPGGMSFETWIDRQIREAEERGEFDGLPGAGKPLTNLGRSHDEMWWIREKLEREGLSTEAVLPTPLQLRKELDRLPETVRGLRTEEEVRAAVRELNERIADYWRSPSGPQIAVGAANADTIVAQWRAERAAENRPAAPSAPVSSEGPQRRRRWWRPPLRRRKSS